MNRFLCTCNFLREMNIATIVNDLKEHNLYITFFDTHTTAYLAYVFVQDDVVQVGFFDSKIQRMTTFVVSGDRVDVVGDQEVLRKEGDLLPLELVRCTLSVDQAKNIFEKVHKEKYKVEVLKTVFVVLQQGFEGPVYNITALTHSLKTLNVKVSADDGVVKQHSCQSLVYPDT